MIAAPSLISALPRTAALSGAPQGDTATGPSAPTTPTSSSAPTTSWEGLPLTQAETDSAIGELRQEIDSVDAALVELVARRVQISKRVGQLRMAAGGTRLSLAREQAVVARFSAELGETGTSLAMLLLRAGRGRI